MKIKNVLAGAILFIASVALSSAASYTLTTGTTASSNGFGNSAGIAFQNSASATFAGPGIVGFGTFSITDGAITSATDKATLVSAFSGFGGTPTGVFSAPGLTANRGTFSRNSVATVGNIPGLNDTFMYLFVGNGATYADSTEFAVLKTAFKFLTADDSVPTPIVYTVTNLNSTLLLGGSVADIRTTGTDSTVTPGFSTQALIPEPSAALLGALGALGLLRRRRN